MSGLVQWLRRPWVWVALALLVTALMVAALRFAPAFQVENIDVQGNRQVSTDAVVTAAGVSSSSPLLTLPLDAIAARVESLDAVSSARVVRDWPNSVRIVVRERRPIGYVETAAGVAMVGSDGAVYLTQPRPPVRMPQLPSTGAESVGDTYVPSGDETDRAVFDVAAGLPASLQRSVTAIAASGPRAVRLTLTGGVVVEWGSPASGDQKATVVKALRGRSGWGSEFTVVDVSAPEAPALR